MDPIVVCVCRVCVVSDMHSIMRESILDQLTASSLEDFDEITSLIIRMFARTSLMSFDFAKRPRESEKYGTKSALPDTKGTYTNSG